ncbi:MAG: PHP domain-containing protein, partial [Vulcanimicrobiaceae bacterium]
MFSHRRYAELRCRSNFSFLEGGSHPEELVAAAAELGLAALALADRDGLYGAVRFAKAAKPLGLAAIVGAELSLDLPGRPRLVCLAADARGYANLCTAISTAQLRGRKGEARLQLDDLAG